MVKNARAGFALRLSAEERAAVDAAAARAGKPAATFARDALIEAACRAKPPHGSPRPAPTRQAPDLREILGHVRRAGNNLRQLLHHAQRYGLFNDEPPTGEQLKAVLQETVRVQRDLTDLVRDGAR
jgi:hypothetical protein